MSYCEPSDIFKRYIQLDTGDTATTDIQIQIGMVEAYLNSRLAVRYAVPFSTTPPEVKRLTIDFVVVKMLEFSFLAMPTDALNNLKIVKDQLEKELGDIIKGNIPLIDEEGTIVSPLSGMGTPESTTSSYNPTSNMLDEIIQVVDSDRLDDEEDALK